MGDFDLVLLVWEDAHEDNDWVDFDLIEERILNKPTICTRVGWLLFDTEEAVVIASEKDGTGGYCDILRIPNGMVREIKLLKAEAIWTPGQDKSGS